MQIRHPLPPRPVPQPAPGPVPQPAPQPYPSTQQQGGAPYQQQAPAAQQQPLGYGGNSGSTEPNWSALAEQHEAQAKRKKLLLIAAGVVALCLVVGGGVFAVAKSGGHHPAAGPTGSSAPVASSAGPSASGTASATAGSSGGAGATPLTAGAVLSAKTITVGGALYTRKATDSTPHCGEGVNAALGALLAAHHCSRLLRATYVSGHTAVTVGIAVVSDPLEAQATNNGATGELVPLTGPGIPGFCPTGVTCALTHADYSRYVYFTLAGPTNVARGKADAVSAAAGKGFAAYAAGAVQKLAGSNG
ncbi:hypothetical protein [Streptacidiphilus cavernicola]|uniref:Uncharacterized protein n=1 Tax=Streptacidiphilus cavernicola TaxID=3342716 RepID=A0ABV6VTN7_9ACTN